MLLSNGSSHPPLSLFLSLSLFFPLSLFLSLSFSLSFSLSPSLPQVFELATGDYLFEPHSGRDYSRDEGT